MTISRRTRGFLVAICLAAPLMARAQVGGEFEYPISVVVDFSGNVLVSENVRNRIGFYGPNGAIGWRKGTQGSGDGEFQGPIGLAVDGRGFLYVADIDNSRVQKFNSATGDFVTKWGSAGSGQGQFRKPVAVAVDAQGNVSVLDSQTVKVQKFSPDGTTYLGSWGGQSGTGDGQFSPLAGGPSDLVIDAAGFAYVSDPGNQRIQRWRIVSDAAGAIQSAAFVGWIGRCTSGTNCDLQNQRSNGATCTATTCSAASSGSNAGQFINPAGMGLDAAGTLYVADTLNNRVQQFANDGTFMRQFGTRGTLAGEFRTPVDVAVSPVGDIFVADSKNERVQRFGSNGAVQASFGGSIALTASLGYPPRPLDALVDPNPIFVFPGQTTSTSVQVTSVSAFTGPITLATTGCCEDLLSEAYMPNAVTTSFSPATVTVPANGSASTTLSITAPSNALPGKLAIPLDAFSTVLNVGIGAGVGVEVLRPIPADLGVKTKCVTDVVVGSIGGNTPGRPEVLPLMAVTQKLFGTKAASPALTVFQIGAESATKMAGWRITISKSATPLRPDQARVTLINDTSWAKGMTTENSANCAAAGQTTQLSMGQSATFLISMADTTTIDLTRQVCKSRFLWCWDNSEWDDFAVFDEGAFWALFGGRQVTINWLFSSGE